MGLVTKEVVKSDWLNITTTPTDNLIDRMIALASKEIETYCNQPIEQATETLYFAGNGYSSFPLKYTSPATMVNLYSRTVPTDDWATVTGTPVVYTNDAIQYIYSSGFTSPFYKAVLTVGYTPIPEDVKLCAYEMVKELYLETPNAGQVDRFGVSAVNETDAGVSWSKAIVKMRSSMERRMQPYRMFSI